jgi:hypothetical protein
MADLDEKTTSSPGWTDRGDMQSQQASANEYNKAAQEKQLEQHSAGKEMTDRQQARLEASILALASSQPERGQDRSQEMERSRGMELSRE